MPESLINLRPANNRVVVLMYDDGTLKKLSDSLISLPDDQVAQGSRLAAGARNPGIRDRWAVVVALPDDPDVTDHVKLGDRVLLEQMEWTRGIHTSAGGEVRDGEKFMSRKIWTIPAEHVKAVDKAPFTEQELNAIHKIWPDFSERLAAGNVLGD